MLYLIFPRHNSALTDTFYFTGLLSAYSKKHNKLANVYQLSDEGILVGVVVESLVFSS